MQVAPATQSGHAVAHSQVMGVGQSLTSVTGSRAIGSTYTNTTSKPILVEVQILLSAGSGANMNKNGVTTQNFGNSGTTTTNYSFSTIVQPGNTYSITASGSPTLIGWYETR